MTGNDRINAAETSKHVTVSGTSDAIGQTVTLYVDGGFLPAVVVNADGTWSTSIDTTSLVDGVHQLRATVAAADGATNTVGDLITIDTVAPTVTLSSDKTHLTAGETATITATFSEGIGGVGANFLTASGGTLSQQTFVNDHTLTAIFTPDTGVDSFTIQANPDSAFDFSGNPSVGTNLTIGLAFDGDFRELCLRRRQSQRLLRCRRSLHHHRLRREFCAERRLRSPYPDWRHGHFDGSVFYRKTGSARRLGGGDAVDDGRRETD